MPPLGGRPVMAKRNPSIAEKIGHDSHETAILGGPLPRRARLQVPDEVDMEDAARHDSRRYRELVLHANNGQFGARHQRLENIIINCHGSPGSLYIGGVNSTDLNIGNVGVFFELAELRYRHDLAGGLRGGCPAGRRHRRGGQNLLRRTGQDGRVRRDCLGRHPVRQCRLLFARGAVGCIDDYEGLTYRFGRPAGISTTSRNRHEMARPRSSRRNSFPI